MASLRQRYESMVAQYGGVAITLWFALFFTTWFVCWLGVKGGLWPEAWIPAQTDEPQGRIASVVFGMGPQVFIAYLMTQLTKPVRFFAVLAATPKVAQLVGREPVSIESAEPSGEAAEQPGA